MSSTGTISEIWRFPVKSMAGERVEQGVVTERGIAGDRTYAILDVESGKIASAKLPRRWARLLECRARSLAEPVAGAPQPIEIIFPDGSTVASEDPDLDDRLSRFVERPVRLVTTAPDGAGYLAVWPDIEGVIPSDYLATVVVADADAAAIEPDANGRLTDLGLALAAPGTFFDLTPLHVVTTATLAHLAALAPETRFPVERFRPNFVFGMDEEGFVENGWAGATMRLGGAVQALGIIPTMRCIMTTLPQIGYDRDPGVLRTIARHNRVDIPGVGTWSCVGAYATVAAAGTVSIGDLVEVSTQA